MHPLIGFIGVFLFAIGGAMIFVQLNHPRADTAGDFFGYGLGFFFLGLGLWFITLSGRKDESARSNS